MRPATPAGLVLAVLLLATGCTHGSAPRAASPAPSSPAPSSSASSSSTPPSVPTPTKPGAGYPLTAGEARAAVARAVLRRADLRPVGLRVRLIKGGDRVRGQVTLDYCGSHFRSESRRLARRQVELVAPGGQDVGVGNEVVAYRDEGAAAAAIQELRSAVRACTPRVFHRSGVPAIPDLRYDASRQHRLAQLPVRDNVLVTAQLVSRDGRRLYSLYLFQRAGAVLDALYLTSPVPPTGAEVLAFEAIAQVSARKLLGPGTTV